MFQKIRWSSFNYENQFSFDLCTCKEDNLHNKNSKQVQSIIQVCVVVRITIYFVSFLTFKIFGSKMQNVFLNNFYSFQENIVFVACISITYQLHTLKTRFHIFYSSVAYSPKCTYIPTYLIYLTFIIFFMQVTYF